MATRAQEKVAHLAAYRTALEALRDQKTTYYKNDDIVIDVPSGVWPLDLIDRTMNKLAARARLSPRASFKGVPHPDRKRRG